MKLLSLFFNFSDFWQKKSIVCSRCASIKLLMSVERVLTSFLLPHPRSFGAPERDNGRQSTVASVQKFYVRARTHNQFLSIMMLLNQFSGGFDTYTK